MNDTANTNFNKFAIPLRWGIVAGIASILMFTVYSMFLMGSMAFWGSTVFGSTSFVVCLVLIGVMASQQRKAMGGYITFKEAFQGIFVSILIMVVLSQIYSAIYTNFIDPAYFEKVKAMSTEFAAQIGGKEAGDMAAERAEQQLESQRGLAGQILGLAGSIILYSIFGFIIAAIVKKEKPAHLAQQ